MKTKPFQVLILSISFLMVFALSGCENYYTEYWVSPKGSNLTGAGTFLSPWQTITHALDAVDYNTAKPPMIRLKKGIYEESFTITKDIAIWGEGAGPVSVWPNDPQIPIQSVSMILRPGGQEGIRVTSGAATFGNLVISGGNLLATNAKLTLSYVEVRDVLGLYGVRMVNVPEFTILNSSVKSELLFSDYAIDIINSRGSIKGLYAGELFDHVINIDPGNSGTIATKTQVLIEDSEIAGSSIFYADGIRIVGPAFVEVRNTLIQRDLEGAEAAGPGKDYNRPHAGISIGGWTIAGSPLVELDGVTTSGFDVGIGIDTEGVKVKVQNSDIAGNSLVVETLPYHGYSLTTWPIVDFGGGPLGSAGKNILHDVGKWAFQHAGPYPAWACFNDWEVTEDLIDPKRIYDLLDISTSGRVNWSCTDASADFYFPPTLTAPPRIITPEGPTVTVRQPTPCFSGPGDDYTLVSTLDEGQQLNLVGRGFGGNWFVVENPYYVGVPCWADGDDVEYRGSLDDLPLIAVPDKPTPTVRPTREAGPPTEAPSNDGPPPGQILTPLPGG